MKAAGFTLVELIVTMVLLGIIAAVAIPRFFDQQAFRERGFYDEAVSAARYAQKFAVASGCDVQFSVAGGVYVLNQRNRSAPPNCANPLDLFTVPVAHPATRAASFTGTTPTGIAFTMTTATVVFNALGQTTDGLSRTVTVGAKSFQIIGATGFVQTP